LRGSFPNPAGIVYLTAREERSTVIADAYVDDRIDRVYAAYSTRLSQPPYQLSRVSNGSGSAKLAYRSETDSGSVQLTSACAGRVAVRITDTPS